MIRGRTITVTVCSLLSLTVTPTFAATCNELRGAERTAEPCCIDVFNPCEDPTICTPFCPDSQLANGDTAVGPRRCNKDLFVPCQTDANCGSGQGNCERAAFIDLDGDGTFEPAQGDTPFASRLVDPSYPESPARDWCPGPDSTCHDRKDDPATPDDDSQMWIPLQVCLPTPGAGTSCDANGVWGGCEPCGFDDLNGNGTFDPASGEPVDTQFIATSRTDLLPEPDGICDSGFTCTTVAEYVYVKKPTSSQDCCSPVRNVTPGACNEGEQKPYRAVRTPYGFTLGRDVPGLTSNKNTVFHIEAAGVVRNYSYQGLHPHDGNGTVVLVRGSDVVLGNDYCGAAGTHNRDNVSVAAGEGDDGKVVLIADDGSICGGSYAADGNNEVRTIIPTSNGIYLKATDQVNFTSASGNWHLTATDGGVLVVRGGDPRLLANAATAEYQPAPNTDCSVVPDPELDVPCNVRTFRGLCVATQTCRSDATGSPALYWYNWTTVNGGPGFTSQPCASLGAGYLGFVCLMRPCSDDPGCPASGDSCVAPPKLCIDDLSDHPARYGGDDRCDQLDPGSTCGAVRPCTTAADCPGPFDSCMVSGCDPQTAANAGEGWQWSECVQPTSGDEKCDCASPDPNPDCQPLCQ